ncbi:selenoneine synthase SenA [Aquabacterium sp. A7-Y]|nr:selenoneine synthase SenA [Aquabacterium sp. A7-Y]
MRNSGRDLLSLALIDSRNCSLHRFGALEQAAGAALTAVPLPGLDPPLWTLGHAGWYQEYWIGRNLERHLGIKADAGRPRLASIEPYADAWYDPAAVPREQRWSQPLPSSLATRSYLVETLESTLELLQHAGESDDDLYFFRLALFHEDLLSEQLACVAQAVGVDVPGLPWPRPAAPRPAIGMPATRWRVGSEAGGFAFDNELPAHEQRLAEFEIDAQPVDWAQYIEFIEDGGYDEPAWWTPEGWSWVQASERRAPRHVEQVRHGVMARRGASLVQLAAHTPVMHLSWHEAQAWCRWAGRRLPSEAEWELAACTAAGRGFRWGEVWEWVADRFQPYPGFVAHPDRDRSRSCFGSHRVLRGGSVATRWRLKHPRLRMWALPERDEAFCGFRSCAA